MIWWCFYSYTLSSNRWHWSYSRKYCFDVYWSKLYEGKCDFWMEESHELFIINTEWEQICHEYHTKEIIKLLIVKINKNALNTCGMILHNEDELKILTFCIANILLYDSKNLLTYITFNLFLLYKLMIRSEKQVEMCNKFI